MKCPRCKTETVVKNGKVRTNQRYRCKSCGYNFTLERKERGKSKEIKRLALHLYLEGLGFRGIARVLSVSNVAVLKWIRHFGYTIKELSKDKKPEAVEIMELDEMWHFIQKKRNDVGSGLLLIEIEDVPLPSSAVVVTMPRVKNYGIR